MIGAISLEQQAKLKQYCQQWQQRTLKTAALDLNSVETTIQAAYLEAGFTEPEIWHYSNPWAAIESLALKSDPRCTRCKTIRVRFNRRISGHLRKLIVRQLTDDLRHDLRKVLETSGPSLFSGGAIGCSCITDELDFQLKAMEQRLKIETLGIDLCLLELDWSDYSTGFHCLWDFCISELGLEHDPRKWQILKDLVQNCGFLLMFEEVCVSIERPCKLRFDAEGKFHAEVEPAIVFADGYEIFAHHGLHPSTLEDED